MLSMYLYAQKSQSKPFWKTYEKLKWFLFSKKDQGWWFMKLSFLNRVERLHRKPAAIAGWAHEEKQNQSGKDNENFRTSEASQNGT